ncbi:Uncharacterised protein [Chryseobacterium taklimakanense]|uniref:DUF5673 domain-containing protein n=2 Tax=Chryseobacterium taklimakanense TaxID=536441 RepID=A0A239WDJ2_9FLAO|nr:Uncharacterised protein [Chryseobacterium taklimakanense]
MILAGILIFLNFLEIFNNSDPRIEKYSNAIAYFILMVIFSKMFWFKNYVQWNRKGIMIKLNNSWGKNYKFEEISNFNLQNNELIISKFNGQINAFNLQNIEPESINKLINILKANT